MHNLTTDHQHSLLITPLLFFIFEFVNLKLPTDRGGIIVNQLSDELLLDIYQQSISINAPNDFIILLEHEITHRAIFHSYYSPQMG